MCKSCQYCFESCYWNLIEKHFCFDEDIALYSEPEKEEKNNNLYDNLAFYDKVAVIAGRSIVTIDPLPKKEALSPIVSQPPRRIRWWEDDADQQNRENEAKILRHSQSNAELVSEDKKSSERLPEDTAVSDAEAEKEKSRSSDDVFTSSASEDSKITEELPIISRLTLPETSSLHGSNSSLDEKPKLRKKSLRERRMSRSLTLDIERAMELPIIKQQTMPKFYVDSPGTSRLDLTTTTPSVLVSPRIRKESKSYEYDLRSVVQIENERKKQIKHAPVHKQNSTSKLLHINIKDKFIRPQEKLKHQLSTGSLPNGPYDSDTSHHE